jgi:hypothetical protein
MSTGKPMKRSSYASRSGQNDPSAQKIPKMGTPRKDSAGVSSESEVKKTKGTAMGLLKKNVTNAVGKYKPMSIAKGKGKTRMNGKATGTAKPMLKMITKKAVSK